MGERESRKNARRNPFRAGGSSKTNSAPPPPKTIDIDFATQRICPSCGKTIKISYNFCKFCGTDITQIDAIGDSDPVLKQLAIAAISDPEPEIRKEAVDTLGNFEEKKVIGLLTYVLLNDADEDVRKEAADELGDIHHPLSLNVFSKALQDPSAKVRKEAIEGLKKIKKKNKPKKIEKDIDKDRVEKIQERIDEELEEAEPDEEE
ncbi:MAG: HEAT repeat protein [Promethearchaeota archaeon]|nr:MAG: HEAT repeat protein [Candidatus Lokiarchaeota archaeon]